MCHGPKFLLKIKKYYIIIFLAANKVSSIMTSEKLKESTANSIELNPEADLINVIPQENNNLPRKNRQFSTTQGII